MLPLLTISKHAIYSDCMMLHFDYSNMMAYTTVLLFTHFVYLVALDYLFVSSQTNLNISTIHPKEKNPVERMDIF